MHHLPTKRIQMCALLFLCSIPLLCQQQQKSLGEVARESRKKNVHATKVIDNDNVNEGKEKPAIPEIAATGKYNIEEIVEAIRTYREKHSPEETESLVRAWYNKYDAMLAKAIDETNGYRDRQKYGYPTGVVDRPPVGEKQYSEWRTTQVQTAVTNQQDMERAGLLSARLQQTIGGVRTGIAKFGLRYDWMKIRFGNANGSY